MQSIIDSGINGILVLPGDALALGKAIGDLYFDKEKCREFGDNGYRKAATVYSRETIYEELMGIYAQAIRQNGAGVRR